ncbi:hypothetical protein [Pseudomonas tohonis]|uniref:hypothetical protein n=1 Tax=Pseudomonas tohonis TaxID=2725477 RepID=UPI0021D9B842|nr:hypothetical protein [Pseudomonas tohonis]UXY55224.1 hypothetical protein N9L84_11845 [Pseudomonas tohonis]
MYLTKFGQFEGNEWESLFQRIFKSKHYDDNYQEMPASPGDFGIEGFVGKTGVAFQCYCPKTNYDQDTLYDKQRDKITRDLNKLRLYENDIKERIGGELIKRWIFITPDINQNKLLKHAKAKEAEVRKWNLSILATDFTVLLHDADFYAKEIHEQLTLQGKAIYIEGLQLTLPDLDGDTTEYEEHILRKSKIRVAASLGTSQVDMDDSKQRARVERVYAKTLESFLSFNKFRQELNTISPLLFHKVDRILGTFESEVDDWRDTLRATPDELTEKVKSDLKSRLEKELRTHIDYTLTSRIVNHAIANWLGLCQLDYE